MRLQQSSIGLSDILYMKELRSRIVNRLPRVIQVLNAAIQLKLKQSVSKLNVLPTISHYQS